MSTLQRLITRVFFSSPARACPSAQLRLRVELILRLVVLRLALRRRIVTLRHLLLLLLLRQITLLRRVRDRIGDLLIILRRLLLNDQHLNQTQRNAILSIHGQDGVLESKQ
jgi:hypothetical protein